MRRLVLQGIAIAISGAICLLAWAWAEARSAFAALGLATVLGLLWLARRFPKPGPMQLVAVAVATFLGSVTLAVLLPSTRVPCDCPALRGCACPIDQHWPLRAFTLLGMPTSSERSWA